MVKGLISGMEKLIIFLKPYGKYLLITWIVIIAVISSIPNLPTPKITTGKVELRVDYIFHFCEYAFLTFITFLTLVRKDFKLPLKKYLLITFCLIIFAVADEYHQKLIPGRAFNVKDILSNLTGVFGGLLICLVVFRIIGNKLNNNISD
jgi:VanZ family protein